MVAHNRKFDDPLKFKMGNDLVHKFQLCEMGTWEDHERGNDKSDAPYTYEVLDRWETQIEIRDRAELITVWWALCTGTFAIRHYRAACNLADKILPHVKEAAEHDKKAAKIFQQYRYPDGF